MHDNLIELRHDSVLRGLTEPIQDILSEPGINEIMINGPHDVFIEKNGEIAAYKDDNKYFTENLLLTLATLIATSTRQKVDAKHPLLSASLPEGERVQIVLPPACERGKVVLSIRKPNPIRLTIDDYVSSGAFRQAVKSSESKTSEDLIPLSDAYDTKQWAVFFKLAVKTRQNIVISGSTGSGKTTFTNALIAAIHPEDRIITIEDVREVTVAQANRVHLLVSKGDQGKAKVSVGDLVQACLRLNPKRILLSELRGAEAFDFLNAINTGHNGSITSIHANNALAVYDRLYTMIKQSDQGRDMPKPEIVDYCRSVVDVIAHFDQIKGQRVLTEVHYEKK